MSAVVVIDSVGAPATVAELLSGRFAGVTVTWPNGLPGSGARIGVRGLNSFFSPGTPLLVIDGIAASGEDFGSPIGGPDLPLNVSVRVVPSRLDDIESFFIERIEVLRGPVAAAMYGSGGAAGVLRVTTRRGVAGPARVRAFAEGTSTPATLSFPDNFVAPGRFTSDGSPIRNCTLAFVAADLCTQDSILRGNPLERVSPFRTGSSQRAGVSVSGGDGRTTFFGGVSGDNQVGLYRDSDQRRLRLDANAAHLFGSRVEAGVRLGYLRGRLDIPPLEILASGLSGRAVDDSLRGYNGLTPDQAYAATVWDQRMARSLLGAHVTWRAKPWIEVGALVGSDRTAVDERNLRTLSSSGTQPALGDLLRERTADVSDRRRTLRLTADLQRQLVGVDSRTTISLDERRERRGESARQTFRNTSDPQAPPFQDESYGLRLPFTIRGLSVSERVARRELALGLGMRLERAGLDDSRVETRAFPSAELSWSADRVRLARLGAVLSALRLSGGIGDAGDYRSDMALIRRTRSAFSPSPSPAVELGRERTREIELGAVVAALDDRVRLSVGHFARRTRDAQLFSPFGVTRGEVSNTGWEAMLDGTLATVGSARWRAALSLTTNRNRVDSLENPPVIAAGFTGFRQLLRVGYPLGGFWGTRFTFADVDGDGLITPSEIQYADSFSYLGSPIPTRALALRNEISLGSRLLLTVRFEHLGGHKRANAVEAGRCGGRSCADAIVPSTPLGRQARAAFKLVKFDESTAYLEDGSFTKLREVSLSVDAPRAWASALSGDRLRLILTGRDLLTWSSYRGLDPETNTGRGIAYSSIDEGELPRLPTYGARIDISW